MRYLVLLAVLAMCAAPAEVRASCFNHYGYYNRDCSSADTGRGNIEDQLRELRQAEQERAERERAIQYQLDQIRRGENERAWQRELRTNPRYQTR